MREGWSGDVLFSIARGVCGTVQVHSPSDAKWTTEVCTASSRGVYWLTAVEGFTG